MAPGAKRISAVTSPVAGSNSSVLTSQPGNLVFCHSMSAGRTTWECAPAGSLVLVMASICSLLLDDWYSLRDPRVNERKRDFAMLAIHHEIGIERQHGVLVMNLGHPHDTCIRKRHRPVP